jgi:hypothetical protein
MLVAARWWPKGTKKRVGRSPPVARAAALARRLGGGVERRSKLVDLGGTVDVGWVRRRDGPPSSGREPSFVYPHLGSRKQRGALRMRNRRWR